MSTSSLRGASPSIVFFTLLAGACTSVSENPTVAVIVEPVIYDADDRAEGATLSQLSWGAEAVARAVALVPTIAWPTEGNPDDAGIDAVPQPQTAMTRFQLCPEERFADQPSLADCSGVLVSSDLVLTSGHCFTATDTCDRYEYATNYTLESAYADAGGPNLMQCQELVIREVGELADGSPIDYSLVRLEHSVDSIDSTVTLRDESLQAGEHLVSLGFPLGIPLKIDPNGEVVTVDRSGFQLLTESYEGSSGSGVYDSAGRLAGILTTGEPDFEWDATRGCQVSRVISGGQSGASERGMNAWVALARACFRKPDMALCTSLADSGASHGSAGLEEPPVVGPGDGSDAGGQGSVSSKPDGSSASSLVPDRPDAGRTTRSDTLLPRPASCAVGENRRFSGSFVPLIGLALALLRRRGFRPR